MSSVSPFCRYIFEIAHSNMLNRSERLNDCGSIEALQNNCSNLSLSNKGRFKLSGPYIYTGVQALAIESASIAWHP